MVSFDKYHLYERLFTSLSAYYKRCKDTDAPYQWHKVARPKQRVPTGYDWRVWLILAGRGFGKTRTGAESIRQWVKEGAARQIALVAHSLHEARHVMVEGSSGLLAVYPPSEKRPTFYASLNKVCWPNGAQATLFGAHSYDALRGPQFDTAWVDELAKFTYPQEAWDQLMLALRLGPHPRVIVTTTPRPLPLIEQLMQDPMVIVTRGTTYENKENLSPSFFKQIIQRYEKSALGSQELRGEVLREREGALWQRTLLQYRMPPSHNLQRIVIGVDPAISHHQKSNETGIIVAARAHDTKAYVLADASGIYSPLTWAKKVVDLYHSYGAHRIVAEINQGGALIENIIRRMDPLISFRGVRARHGKVTRAEPIVALYEQGHVFHAKPFDHLEAQMCTYIPQEKGTSPDRIDALVWALTDLMLRTPPTPRISAC